MHRIPVYNYVQAMAPPVRVRIFLSNYYATNGKLLAEGIPYTPLGTHEDCFPEIRTTFKFRFVPLTAIEKYINKIDIKKSSGIPGISTRLFKDAFRVLSVELTH